MKYDFKLKKLEGKVQININNWLYPDSNIIEIQKINGKRSITYITEALEVGSNINSINSGDIILLSKVSCDVATSPRAYYEVEKERYFNIPFEQIIGVFKDRKVSLDNLEVQSSNIVFKRTNRTQGSVISIEEKDTMVGEVIKTSNNSSFREGDIVVVRDNVSTPIKFGADEYFATEEKFIVGILDNTLSIENMEVINEYVLMRPYISKNVLNSTILETPNINYEDLDYSDINNRNLFRVCYSDKSLNINRGDIILLNRDFTNYMYYGNEKYFVISDKKWILGKIIERDKQCN